MSESREIFQFGIPYIKRYWVRFALGVALGLVFGLSNACFVWATKTMVERLTPPDAASTSLVQQVVKAPTAFSKWTERTSNLKKSVDRVVDPWLPLKGRPIDWRQVVGGLLMLPLLAATRGYLGYLSSYCISWVGERVIKDIRLDLLIKLNSLSLDFFNKSTMGEVIARVNGDTSALQRCLSLGFSDVLKEPVTILGCLIALFFLDAKLTLLAMIFIPLTAIPITILTRKVRKAVKSNIQNTISQDSLLVEVYSSIRVVKAFCLETRQISRFREMFQRSVKAGMKNVQAKELINPFIETISMLGLGVVMIVVFWTNRSIPDMVGFLTGVGFMYTPMKRLGSLTAVFQQASVGATRLIELFKLAPTVRDAPNAVEIKNFVEGIRVENVTFGYRDEPVIKKLTLNIPRGAKLGVAGRSGSGKSTLIQLMLRFYDPREGRMLIDGQDFREVTMHSLRQQMAMVSQDVVIFDQTVAENIACGGENVSQAEVEHAARSAFAHEFIMALPEGYNTRVGERGVTLSGGQRQRISIARAFARNAPILLLDEATASLDSQAETEVQAAIDRLSENRTVICVAHRLATLRQSTQIIVIDEGVIVEHGTFDQLLLKGGLFSAMAAQQGIRP